MFNSTKPKYQTYHAKAPATQHLSISQSHRNYETKATASPRESLKAPKPGERTNTPPKSHPGT